MKKSKHFRKDVILARIIAGVVLILLIVLLVWGISLLEKPSGEDKNSQNSQNTENTQDIISGDKDTQKVESEDDTQLVEDSNGTSVDETQDTTDEPYPEENILWIKTNAETLRLRAEPNTSSSTLERIPKGTKLQVIEDLDGWYKVIYNEKTGYVSKSYVEVLPEE